MPEDLITPENLSKDLLQELFQQAYLDVSRDEDGDLVVRDEYRCFVFPDADKRYIHFMSLFRGGAEATLEAKLAYVNRVNDEVVIVRACVTDAGGICFDYYVPVHGGITRAAVALMLRRFFATVRTALARDEGDVVG